MQFPLYLIHWKSSSGKLSRSVEYCPRRDEKHNCFFMRCVLTKAKGGSSCFWVFKQPTLGSFELEIWKYKNSQTDTPKWWFCKKLNYSWIKLCHLSISRVGETWLFFQWIKEAFNLTIDICWFLNYLNIHLWPEIFVKILDLYNSKSNLHNVESK